MGFPFSTCHGGDDSGVQRKICHRESTQIFKLRWTATVTIVTNYGDNTVATRSIEKKNTIDKIAEKLPFKSTKINIGPEITRKIQLN